MAFDRLVSENRVRDLVRHFVGDRWELFDNSPEFHCAIEATAQSTALIVDCLAYGCDVLRRESNVFKAEAMANLRPTLDESLREALIDRINATGRASSGRVGMDEIAQMVKDL